MQEKTKNNKEIKNKETSKSICSTDKKQKSILKPFVFFTLLIACVGIGVLYKTPDKSSVHFTSIKESAVSVLPKPVEITPTFNTSEKESISAHSTTKENNLTKVDTEINSSKDKLILSQTQTIKELNEQIHRLEIDNLNLTEKMAHHEKLTPLTIRLMEEIYTGKPFSSALNALLAYDKTNVLALNVKEKLSAYALTGIPTSEELKRQFLAQMKITKDSFYIHKNNITWDQKWAAFFKSLVHVYPEDINPQNAKGIDFLFLAQQQVQNGQFEQALKSIEKLPAQSKQFLNNFVQNAHRYLEAVQIIDVYLNK